MKITQKHDSAGIKEIARQLGISIGTVDRALHGRPGISAATCARVLKKAEELRYRPNVAARSLRLNRRLRIAVHLPRNIASFFDPLREGIRTAAAGAGIAVELEFRSYPYMGNGDVALLRAEMGQEIDGVLLTAGDPARFDPMIRRITERGTPVVCVASDAPMSGRLTSVTVDAEVSGGIAGELLARTVQKAGSVATITGDLNTLDHAEKLKGFATALARFAPHLTLQPVMETHDRAKDAERAAQALLRQTPRPAGIYISTANSLPALRTLEAAGALREMQVITTDLFPELARFLESGAILATLYQRPGTQGKIALEALLRHLLGGSVAATRLAPHVILRSNLALFRETAQAPAQMDEAHAGKAKG